MNARAVVPAVCALVAALAALATRTASAQEPPTAPVPPAPTAVAPEPPPAPQPPPPASAAPAPPEATPAPAPEKPRSDKSLSVGVGVRVGITKANTPIGIAPLNVRPYISGQVHEYIKFEGNLDATVERGEERIRFLDVVAKFEFHDLFNVWGGRFLPPTDRSNLSGPYYQNAWNYPTGVNSYPSIYAGRDDGVAVWGQVGGGRFKYQAGIFDGGVPDTMDSMRYAGRLTLNLLDPEPGYYNSSTYYGTKDILALGAVAQFQKNGAATAAGGRDDAFAWSLDLLFEKKLGAAGVITTEGAFYGFEKAGQGHSFFALASYLVPGKIGIGALQPTVRFQSQHLDAGGVNRIVDTGVNYIIDGHNARLALVWQHQNLYAQRDVNVFTLGVQVQK